MIFISGVFLAAAVVFHKNADKAARTKNPNSAAVVPPARLISVICGLSGIGIFALAMLDK